MKTRKDISKLIILFVFPLMLAVFLASTPSCMADDHKGKGKHYGRHDGSRGEEIQRGARGGGRDKGNEFTGQFAAWSLAAANLTVALSLLLKGVNRFVPLGPEARKSLTGFNSTQKKYLMRFHYILNPAILLVALLHWSLSRCRSTSLPEWGLLAMAAIVLLGLVLKLKLCPRGLLKSVYKVHTQPVLLLILVSMLVVGHLSMD